MEDSPPSLGRAEESGAAEGTTSTGYGRRDGEGQTHSEKFGCRWILDLGLICNLTLKNFAQIHISAPGHNDYVQHGPRFS